MIQPPILSPDARIFTRSDIRKLFSIQKKQIFKAACIGAFIIFSFCLIGTASQYKIEASFKEGADNQSFELHKFEKFMGATGRDSQIMSVIQSYRVLKPVIARMGLQASVSDGGWLSKVLRRMKENMMAENKHMLPERDWFVFRDLVYEGEKPIRLNLQFVDAEHFSVSSGATVVAWGSVGKPIELPEAKWTLEKAPVSLKVGFSYPLRIESWISAAHAIRSQFTIKAQKMYQNIFDLHVVHRDRHFGVRLLNELMEEYRNYLKRDHDEIVKGQLTYLEQKQDEIGERMSKVFDEYTTYLQENISQSGQILLEQEVAQSSQVHLAMSKQSLAIDLELERIHQMERDGQIILSSLEDSPFAQYVKKNLAQIADLKEQRSLIERFFPEHVSHFNEQQYEDQKEEIKSELKGIDLQAAHTLFIDYNNKLDQSLVAANHFSRLGFEIMDPDFEINSLSAVLSDPLSQKLIMEACEIALKLKDEKHRSEKEKERWNEELTLQKKILKDHLEQLYKVEQFTSDMIQEKIAALLGVRLDCITGHLSVLQEGLQHSMQDRKNIILADKRILEEKMAELRSQFSHIPSKWRKEKWLDLKTQMGIKMIQTLTELVESKTINSHLHHIESKPLDKASLPPLPIYPYLRIKAFLGAIFAALASFSRAFIRSILSGFPMSGEKLRAMRYSVLGSISFLCDGPITDQPEATDLDSLRQISLMIDSLPRGRAVALIEGKGPDYSHALAGHLSRMSLKSLIVRCDFPVKCSSLKAAGLLQVLKKEVQVAPLSKMQGYDYLSSGGYTPYGVEMVRSREFGSFLEQVKKNYDAVLLVFRSSLHAAESKVALSLSDQAFVTVCGEPIEQLTLFADWAYHEGRCRLAFLEGFS